MKGYQTGVRPSPGALRLLVDNGSLRPAAILALRRLAADLGRALGHPIHPVSFLHSDQIDPADLGGRPAEILESFLRARCHEGGRSFIIAPLFFGPCAAITRVLPKMVATLTLDIPDIKVHTAPPLVDPASPDDTRLAQILADLIDDTASRSGWQHPSIALCDHGSPDPAVTAVRDLLAAQLRQRIGHRFPILTPCSMERRPGADYAFNDPLLENLLGTGGFQNNVIASLLFLLPGNHAGPNGDIHQILSRAGKSHPTLSTRTTPLVHTHPKLIPLLASRFDEADGAD